MHCSQRAPCTMSGAGAGGEDTQLAADVKAFAAQLGLASGGAFPDGFDDFAPDKAGKRIGGGDKPKKVDKKQQAGKQQQQQSAAGGAVAGRRQDGKQQQGDRWQKDGGKQQRQGDGQHQQGGRWQKDGGQQQQQRKPWQKDGQQQEGGRWQKDGGQQQRKPWQQQQGGGSWDEEEPTAAAKVPNAKSILPRDEPTIWHEAASTLPALPASAKEPAPELVKQRHKQAAHLLLVEEQVGGYGWWVVRWVVAVGCKAGAGCRGPCWLAGQMHALLLLSVLHCTALHMRTTAPALPGG